MEQKEEEPLAKILYIILYDILVCFILNLCMFELSFVLKYMSY